MRASALVSGSAAVLGAAGVLAAAAARRPVIRRWPASIVQAVAGTPASEAPRLLIALHSAVGVAALVRGGVAVPLANAAAVAALAGLGGDADRSARALDAALEPLDGPPLEPPSGRLVSGRAARSMYLRAADVAYGDDPAQRLDVWAVAGVPAGAPVLIEVHGGGWTSGDKALAASPLMAYLAERGWVCVTVNYRLGRAHRWPAMIVDVKRAIAWVKDHIAEHGGDPGFVVISGGSAGGHLASLAALTPNDPEFQPGFADADTTVAAAVPLYGVHDFSVDEHGLHHTLEYDVLGTRQADDLDTWRRASPLHRAGPDAPPFLVIHGSADTIVAVGQSRRFVRRLREVSRAPVCFAELPHAQHGFDAFPTARTGHTVRAIHRFLTAVHDRHKSVALRAAG
jgi:acetyl esterase/lipase